MTSGLAAGALVLCVCITLGPSIVRADALDACVEAATVAMVERGARLGGEPEVRFLREGERATVRATLEADGCLGFLAVGHAGVHDIDLTLYTGGGIALTRDVEVDARPYVRYCGARGLRLAATVQMFKGRGEVRIMRFEDAPPTLPDLHRTVGGCFATAGGIRRPAADVGPAPPRPSLAVASAEVERELGLLGWRRHGEPERGTLTAQQRLSHPTTLAAGRCWALVAVGDGSVTDLDLYVRRRDGRIVARDDGRASRAMVKLCTEDRAGFILDVRVAAGGGPYELRTYALDERGHAPDHLRGLARIGWRELARRLAARRMTPRPVAWGWLRPGGSLSIPVPVRAGTCYAFAGIASEELRGADLDLLVLDEDENLLAWDLSTGSEPVVYRCAQRTGTLRVVGRVYGGRGRYLVAVGESG